MNSMLFARYAAWSHHDDSFLKSPQPAPTARKGPRKP